MRTYTTKAMSGHKVDTFMAWFDREIGTEADVDNNGDGNYTVTFFELEANEVSKCRYFENKKLNDLKRR